MSCEHSEGPTLSICRATLAPLRNCLNKTRRRGRKEHGSAKGRHKSSPTHTKNGDFANIQSDTKPSKRLQK